MIHLATLEYSGVYGVSKVYFKRQITMETFDAWTEGRGWQELESLLSACTIRYSHTIVCTHNYIIMWKVKLREHCGLVTLQATLMSNYGLLYSAAILYDNSQCTNVS